MIKLKNSGYNPKFRTEVVNSAIKAFEKMVNEDSKGIKPLFRDNKWKFEERLLAKQNKKQIGTRIMKNQSTKVYFLCHQHQAVNWPRNFKPEKKN